MSTTLEALDHIGQIVVELAQRDVPATVHHAGGGCWAVQILLDDGERLLTAAGANNDDGPWLIVDWETRDGELLGCIELQVRPWDHADAATPGAVAAALASIIRRPTLKGT